MQHTHSYYMIESILDYERGLFFALNGSDSALLDRFMWLYSGKAVWIPVAVFIAIILLYKRGWKESLFIVLALALVITLCDQFASGVCKPMFARFRPTHHPEFMNEVETVFGYRGGRYGFMSSHAANAFGFATFMVFMFRHALFSWVIYIWATLTAYSRIYLGVHFISDIVGGILVGVLFGYLVFRLYRWARARVLARQAILIPPNMAYTGLQKKLTVCGICATIVVILVFNSMLTTILR